MRPLPGILAMLAVALPFQAFAQDRSASQPDVTCDPTSPVLELSYSGGMIADPDPTPFVRVFCEGRVLIHYPAYTKRAGEYELVLSPQELDELLATFAGDQLLTIEPDRMASLAAEVQATGPVEKPEDHGVTANVEVRFESVTPADPARAEMVDVERRFSIPAAAVEAGAQAPVEPLQNFAAGIRQLEALAEHPGLERVP